MWKKILVALSVLALARAQIPSLGWCPEYTPMADFDLNRFLGVWYEAERYFQLTEVVSRCVMANYTKAPDGKYRVSNEVTNRITGIKRVLEGEIKPAPSKGEEGKLNVKYTSVPLTPETRYSVLKTDYDNYAVLWSCSGIGPIHTQNAWLMTRDRIPSQAVLQTAYGVLDNYKISKSFFVKTNQEDCEYLAAESTEASTNAEESETQEQQEQQEQQVQQVQQEEEGEKMIVRSIVPDAPEVILQQKQVIDLVPQTIMKLAEAKKSAQSVAKETSGKVEVPLTESKKEEDASAMRRSDVKA